MREYKETAISGHQYTRCKSVWSMAVPLLLMVVIALCGYVIWQRVRVRKEGWS